jgi:hypothetical protein
MSEQVQSEIAQLAMALSLAQGEMAGAKKDAFNPHFKSKYADLASIWEAAREPLSKNGLAVVQMLEDSANPDSVAIRTVLLHKSGERMESVYSMPTPRWDPQGVGTAITYGRRYALASVLGIAPEDDDAEAATQSMQERPARPKTNGVKGEEWECQACGLVSPSSEVSQLKATKDTIKYGIKAGDLIYQCTCKQWVKAEKTQVPF